VHQPDGRRAAVKTFLAGAVDEDGDPVDPTADEDLHKECATLQRVDNPHLLTFSVLAPPRMAKGLS
jgi:hypothetical protein